MGDLARVSALGRADLRELWRWANSTPGAPLSGLGELARVLAEMPYSIRAAGIELNVRADPSGFEIELGVSPPGIAEEPGYSIKLTRDDAAELVAFLRERVGING